MSFERNESFSALLVVMVCQDSKKPFLIEKSLLPMRAGVITVNGTGLCIIYNPGAFGRCFNAPVYMFFFFSLNRSTSFIDIIQGTVGNNMAFRRHLVAIREL